MAKAKAETTSTGPNYEWVCNHPDCGQTSSGFPDVDAAATDASKHYSTTHDGSDYAPNFSYQDLNIPPEHAAPPDLHEIWANIPDDTPLTKADLAPMFDMG